MKGVEYLAEAGRTVGLPVITEVTDSNLVHDMLEYVDMFEIGQRNMQNYALLNAVGSAQHPVILNRGIGATITHWLMSAEYILSYGNNQIALCEQGILTANNTHKTFDLNAFPTVKELSHLPILADVSNGAGKAAHIEAMARGAIAAGANGIIVDLHSNPAHAMAAGERAITPAQYKDLITDMKRVDAAINA